MASIRLNAPLVLSLGAIWPPVCAIVVGLRFYTRRLQRQKPGIDDWLTIPALVLVICMSATVLRGAALHILGYPTPPTDPALAFTQTSYAQTVTRKIFIAIELMQVTTLGCVKLSCMYFYRRIFRGRGTKTFDIISYTIIGFIAAWTISYFFALLFMCKGHLDYLWTSLANEAKCINTERLQDSFAATDLFTDLIILIFPIPLVYRLQMSSRKKLAVYGIFTLGGLAIAASVTRLAIYVEVETMELSDPDPDLISTSGIYFMIIEAGFGLCAACLPSLYGLGKTKGLKTLVNNFQSIFSRDSSRKSSRASSNKFRRMGSQNSDAEAIVLSPGTKSKSTDIELGDISHEGGIQVTTRFETEHSKA